MTDISHPTYAYYLTICLDSAGHRLYSVRIYHTHAVYLPIVLRNS